MYIIDVITIFPNIFDSFLDISFIKKARLENKIQINIYNLRDFTKDKNRKVDDEPYGGGGGMILKPEPIFEAIRSIKRNSISNPYVVLLTPQGCTLNQAKVNMFAYDFSHLIFICGRYEGFDERVLEIVDEELSIGDFVLSGGEIPAMVVVESIVRILPSVIGNKQSFENDSFYNGYLDYPQYTRPEVFEDLVVPSVLVSGDHKKINDWRAKKALLNTYKKRSDLLTEEEKVRIHKGEI